MRRLAFALALMPGVAFAQTPTMADVQQAGMATASDLSSLVVNLRAQLLADQREIADLQKQIAEAKKPAEAPKP